MRKLYDVNASDVILSIADEIAGIKGISRALAKKLVINALIYNCVQDEIIGQVNFLMDEEGDNE